jgi:hypothetical protein
MNGAQRKAIAKHRARLKRRGVVRVEVQVPKPDAPLIRAAARALRDDPDLARVELDEHARGVDPEHVRERLDEQAVVAALAAHEALQGFRVREAGTEGPRRRERVVGVGYGHDRGEEPGRPLDGARVADEVVLGGDHGAGPVRSPAILRAQDGVGAAQGMIHDHLALGRREDLGLVAHCGRDEDHADVEAQPRRAEVEELPAREADPVSESERVDAGVAMWFAR